MTTRERTWFFAALVLTAFDIILPYTVFRKEGAWAFWTVLTVIVLAGGVAYTGSWKDPEAEKSGRKVR